jgi:hypothetical protein
MSLTGLLHTLLSDDGDAVLRSAVSDARAGSVSALDLTAPPSMRPFVAAALADDTLGAGRPVLAVTATGREAEDLVAALHCLLPEDSVVEYPAWETLPHERLSPRSDTIGRRLAVLRRLVHPAQDDEPVRVVVAPVRSVLQPQVAGFTVTFQFRPVTVDAVRQMEDATRDADKAVKDTTKSTESFGAMSVAVGAIAAAAMVKIAGAVRNAAGRVLNMTNQQARLADEIDKTSIRTGLATDTLQELRFVGDQLGVSFNTFEGVIQSFTRRIPQMLEGTGRQAEIMEQLGVDEVSIGDTIGVAAPADVRRIVTALVTGPRPSRKYSPATTIEANSQWPHGWPADSEIEMGRGRDVVLLKHSKGGDMSEWPEDLRVREMPMVAREEVAGHIPGLW